MTNLDKKILTHAKFVLTAESEAIESLKNTINDSFVSAVKLLLGLKGKLVITGIGKSANIAQKIVATMVSTGQQAVFMHGTDAMHGDLGIIQANDALLLISKSGNTHELKQLMPHLKAFEVPIMAITANEQSYLAVQADIHLYTPMAAEACPLDLAPTVSTTLALALGDALAMCIMRERNFTPSDFGSLHPAGSLGNKLNMKVSAIYPNNPIPLVEMNADIKTTISTISKNRLGIALVVNAKEEVCGVVTDGDVRRMLDKYDSFGHLVAEDIMTKNPKYFEPNGLANDALRYMKMHNITQLPILENNKALGVIHMHDLLNAGLD